MSINDRIGLKILNCDFAKCKDFYYQYIKPYYYVDSKWYLFGIAMKEMIEILIQFHALLLYGGINIFNTNENILAQEAYVVRGKYYN